MIKKSTKVDNLTKYMTAILISSLILAGAFFEFVSSILTICLLTILLIYIFKEKEIMYIADYNTFVISFCSMMYLVAAIWAIDSGMSCMGFIKFIPMLFFYLLVCRMRENRERLIEILPIIGAGITFFAILMMQFRVFKKYVSVADRLSGTFQYPNTFAIFLLICLIITLYSEKNIKRYWGYTIILLVGILYSGSRTVWILTIATIILYCFNQKKYLKKISLAILIIAFLILFVLVFWKDSMIAVRIRNFSFSSSTLLGRLLYVKDAWKLIIKYPFGMGYYGYYFMEQEIQTGGPMSRFSTS